jgi:PAS domain S-box-containing protein
MKALSSNQPVTAQDELRKLRLRCAQFEQRMDELRRMLLELGQERDQLRQLYDSVPVACMTLDASGALLEGNARAAALLGMEPAFLSGLRLANAIAVPQHVERLRAHLAEVMRGGDRHHCELWLRKPGGHVIPVRLESAALRGRTPGGPERCRTVIIECSAPSETPWEARGFQSVPAPRERRDSDLDLLLGPAMPGRGATVLVVEDESLVRKAVQHYLVGAGYHVLTASDGAEAIERWNAHGGAIDLVLTDLSLAEGATGPEIVETLRSVRPEVAVLYMSACPPELLARRGFVLPAGGALEKPFAKSTLLERVAQALGNRPCEHELE